MEKRHIIYIGLTIGVILFIYLVPLPSVLRILNESRLDPLYSIIIVVGIVPAITILLIIMVLSYVKSLYSEDQKGKVKDIITPKLTEKETFEESIFDNEKFRVLQAIKTLSKDKGNQIPLSAIQEKQNLR